MDFGKYANWHWPEVAAAPGGVQYLCWLCSLPRFRRQDAYSHARAALIAALQVEGLV